MNIQAINFEDIVSVYYDGTAACDAANTLVKLIESRQNNKLAHLLRDYRKEKITLKDEIDFRAATDRLIKCYSALEIASLFGFIPNINDTDFGKQSAIILHNTYVRDYYERFYPERLPQLFRYRLDGKHTTTIDINPSKFSQTIIVFLELDRRFMNTLEDGYLLRMLDSFILYGYSFSDVVNLINQPREFVDALINEDNDTTLSRTVTELSIFMQFCFDLNKLFNQVNDYPLLQSAMWSHYGYWFDIIGSELNKKLGQALDGFLNWTPVTHEKESINAIREYVRDARTVLESLTSGDYAVEIKDCLNKYSD